MYRIGYIDDESTQYENYKKKISRYDKDLELVLLKGHDMKEFLNEMFKEQIDVLLIDYRMVNSFGFNGSKLISYINDHVCDLECFILTAVSADQINDGLVPERNRYPKTIFDTEGEDPQKVEKFTNFLRILKDSSSVFKTRQEGKIIRYKELLEKKKKRTLNLTEEEEFVDLYKVLSSYGLVEYLPKKLLHSNFDDTLDSIIKTGEKIVENHRNEKRE